MCSRKDSTVNETNKFEGRLAFKVKEPEGLLGITGPLAGPIAVSELSDLHRDHDQDPPPTA
jgi:hypothetical protein